MSDGERVPPGFAGFRDMVDDMMADIITHADKQEMERLAARMSEAAGTQRPGDMMFALAVLIGAVASQAPAGIAPLVPAVIARLAAKAIARQGQPVAGHA